MRCLEVRCACLLLFTGFPAKKYPEFVETSSQKPVNPHKTTITIRLIDYYGEKMLLNQPYPGVFPLELILWLPVSG